MLVIIQLAQPPRSFAYYLNVTYLLFSIQMVLQLEQYHSVNILKMHNEIPKWMASTFIFNPICIRGDIVIYPAFLVSSDTLSVNCLITLNPNRLHTFFSLLNWLSVSTPWQVPVLGFKFRCRISVYVGVLPMDGEMGIKVFTQFHKANCARIVEVWVSRLLYELVMSV